MTPSLLIRSPPPRDADARSRVVLPISTQNSTAWRSAFRQACPWEIEENGASGWGFVITFSERSRTPEGTDALA